jgi:hypothetical protein
MGISGQLIHCSTGHISGGRFTKEGNRLLRVGKGIAVHLPCFQAKGKLQLSPRAGVDARCPNGFMLLLLLLTPLNSQIQNSI